LNTKAILPPDSPVVQSKACYRTRSDTPDGYHETQSAIKYCLRINQTRTLYPIARSAARRSDPNTDPPYKHGRSDHFHFGMRRLTSRLTASLKHCSHQQPPPNQIISTRTCRHHTKRLDHVALQDSCPTQPVKMPTRLARLTR
jgi:hypothetical protein